MMEVKTHSSNLTSVLTLEPDVQKVKRLRKLRPCGEVGEVGIYLFPKLHLRSG
jgi:hypothetical protein